MKVKTATTFGWSRRCRTGVFGRGIRAKFDAARAEAHRRRTRHSRDEFGAITHVGRSARGNRRVWLGGISAQRGF